MTTEKDQQPLGEYIHQRRESRGISIDEAAAQSRLHPSYWRKLEAGRYQTPSPRHLKVIAKVLSVAFEDLYALAGYDVPERLPSFRPYLRAKTHLPPEAIAELERYYDLLRAYYGIPKNQSVFPPRQAALKEREQALRKAKKKRRAA